MCVLIGNTVFPLVSKVRWRPITPLSPTVPPFSHHHHTQEKATVGGWRSHRVRLLETSGHIHAACCMSQSRLIQFLRVPAKCPSLILPLWAHILICQHDCRIPPTLLQSIRSGEGTEWMRIAQSLLLHRTLGAALLARQFGSSETFTESISAGAVSRTVERGVKVERRPRRFAWPPATAAENVL